MRTPLALVVALTTLPAQAADQALINTTCAGLAGLAESAARRHQEGVSLEEVLAIINRNPQSDIAKLQPLMVDIWDSPRYLTREHQDRAISQWRNVVHVECLKWFVRNGS